VFTARVLSNRLSFPKMELSPINHAMSRIELETNSAGSEIQVTAHFASIFRTDSRTRRTVAMQCSELCERALSFILRSQLSAANTRLGTRGSSRQILLAVAPISHFRVRTTLPRHLECARS